MIVSLFLKEMKNNSFFSRLRKGNVLSLILELITTLIYVVIEVVVFSLLLNKVDRYVGASRALVIIFLFLVTIINVFYLAFKVKKSLYNKDDNIILLTKPISPYANTFSKVLFIYLKSIMNNFVIALPILLIYVNKFYYLPRIYFLACLYPFIISIFETGLSYIVSIPIYEVEKLLKRHAIIKTIFSTIVSVLLCFVYYFILSTFLNLVRDNNILSMFSLEAINNFTKISKFLFPTYFYIEIIEQHYLSLIVLLVISFITFTLGTLIGSQIYFRNLKTNKSVNKKVRVKNYRLTKPFFALLKKEVKILFNEKGASTLSYSSLLVMQPILSVVVVTAMDTVFNTGMLSYISSYFPYVKELIGILFVTLFACFINNSASFSLSREKDSLRVLKTIPVKFKRQAFVKLLVPYVGSIIMTFISLFILLIIGKINFLNSLFTFIYTALILLLLEIISFNADIRHPMTDENSSNTSSLVGLVAIILPLITALFMFILNYIGIPSIITIILIIFGLISILIPVCIVFNLKVSKRFIALEMRN